MWVPYSLPELCTVSVSWCSSCFPGEGKMWRLIKVTHLRKGCEKHGIKAACGPTTHTCCTMCLQSWWWWHWLSLVLLCLSPANPSLSPAAAGSEQAMGPAFPVHEAAVRAEGIVRVMGTPGRTPASPRGSQDIQRRACCFPRRSLERWLSAPALTRSLSLPLNPDHGAATEAGRPAEAGDRPGGRAGAEAARL